MKLILNEDNLRAVADKLKELWADIEITDRSPITLKYLSALAYDFKKLKKSDKRTILGELKEIIPDDLKEEFILLYQTVISLENTIIDETSEKIVTGFLAFTKDLVTCDEGDKQALKSIPSILEDVTTLSHINDSDPTEAGKAAWQKAKNGLFIRICQARSNYTLKKIDDSGFNINSELDAALVELNDLYNSINRRYINLTCPLDYDDSYKALALISANYFNTAYLHTLKNEPNKAVQNYLNAQAINDGDKAIRELAKNRIKDFTPVQTEPVTFKFKLKDKYLSLHKPYFFKINKPKHKISPWVIGLCALGIIACLAVFIALLSVSPLTIPFLAPVAAYVTGLIPALANISLTAVTLGSIAAFCVAGVFAGCATAEIHAGAVSANCKRFFNRLFSKQRVSTTGSEAITTSSHTSSMGNIVNAAPADEANNTTTTLSHAHKPILGKTVSAAQLQAAVRQLPGTPPLTRVRADGDLTQTGTSPGLGQSSERGK